MLKVSGNAQHYINKITPRWIICNETTEILRSILQSYSYLTSTSHHTLFVCIISCKLTYIYHALAFLLINSHAFHKNLQVAQYEMPDETFNFVTIQKNIKH